MFRTILFFYSFFSLVSRDQTLRTEFRKVSRVSRCSRTARNRARRLEQILLHLQSYNGRQAGVSQNIRKICPVLIAPGKKGGYYTGQMYMYRVCVRLLLILTYGLTPAQSGIGM